MAERFLASSEKWNKNFKSSVSVYPFAKNLKESHDTIIHRPHESPSVLTQTNKEFRDPPQATGA